MTSHFDSNILSAIFRRRGEPSLYTKLFDDLLPEQQQLLLKMVTLKENELPVLACVKAIDNWFLLTTDRAIWTSAGKSQEINTHDIQQATIGKQPLLQVKQALIRGDITRADLQHLTVTTMDKTQHIIELEAGSPLNGISNVLHWMGRANSKKSQA